MIHIVSPRSAHFQRGNLIHVEGTATDGETRVVIFEKVSGELRELNIIPVSAGAWRISTQLAQAGQRTIVFRGVSESGDEVSSLEFLVTVTDFKKLVPIPGGINAGVTRAKQKTMLDIFGTPGELTENCSAVTNAKLKKRFVRRNVGPFEVEGLDLAVDALERIFTRVRADIPDLYDQLGTAGMVCCRRVRTKPGKPKSKNFSNHSWGTAIDLKVSGTLDKVGDGLTQLGMLHLAPYFHAEHFYWGAGFSGALEDAMHFEASDELVKRWKSEGRV